MKNNLKSCDVHPRAIVNVARRLGIPAGFLELYGNFKAKISLDILKTRQPRNGAKYIVVTGITPTPFGEGKTVTTIGLSMALSRIGKKAAACIRQPSLGPFFGVKGGGLGGGRSQVIPSEDISLHFTGDIHAVSIAHNLCASFIDNHLYHSNDLDIDVNNIYWNRVVDTNDRSLRSVRIGVGGGALGVERSTRFDITAASEIMAIVALATSVADLRKRLARIVLAMTKDRRPVTARDLKVDGALAALLWDALKPNLVQTIEGTPCFVHTGPFANITHGNSSILADKIALSFADYVVTEAGFGADCGLEKFIDIKTRASGLKPHAAVLVASVRAVKSHSGKFRIVPGKPLDRTIYREDLEAVRVGSANLVKQVENVLLFGLPCVVAINRFRSDTDSEIALLRQIALGAGAFDCVVNETFDKGSAGGVVLAKSVVRAVRVKSRPEYLYPANAKIKAKIETIAREVYGAAGVRFEPAAERHISLFEKLGYGRLPVCMAKTPLSLSHDPDLKGRPEGFILPVRDVRPSIGAGFLYVLCGAIMTMPSLPSHPIGERVDIDSRGRIIIKE